MTFTPTAWAKLLYLRDYGTTEVGGFGISSVDDLLLVEDIVLVEQVCSWVHVAFNDASVADFYDEQVDLGRQPTEFSRIWIHTHPGECPQPSGVDKQTFARVFGTADWAVMAILACGGQSYARLRFNAGPGGDIEIPMAVDYGRSFAGSDEAAWEAEYLANVRPEMAARPPRPHFVKSDSFEDEILEDMEEDWNYLPADEEVSV